MAFAIVSISCAALFFRKAQPTHPLITSGLRLAIASFCLWPIVWYRKIPIDGSLWKMGVYAGLCYAVHFGAWVWSLNLTSVAASVTLVTATPILLGIWAWVTGRDKPTGRLWLGIGLGIVGVSVIGFGSEGGGNGQWIGDLLALLGAIAMAGYLLIARQLKSGQALPLIAMAATVGAATLIFSAWLLGVPLRVHSLESLAWIALAALIPQLVGHTCLTLALRSASPTTVAMGTVAEPVGAAALAWFFLQEKVSGVILFGCSLTMAAVLIALNSGGLGKDNHHD